MSSPIIAAPNWGASRGHTVRLTRRGRLLLAGVGVVAALAVVALLVAPAVAQSLTSESTAPISAGEALAAEGRAVGYTVVSGDTLWDLAAALAPGSDPRPLVDRIQQLNGLPDSQLAIGARLWLPLPEPAPGAKG